MDMTHDSTNEGADTMTDATTLQSLIGEAEDELKAASRWAATADRHAPLAMKVKDQERIDLARIELDALRHLEPEG